MKYKIEWVKDQFVVGKKEPTAGNDEDFPTFKLDDGRTVSVHHSRVVEEIEEDEEAD